MSTMRKVVLRCVVLSCVCAVTWLVTRTLMAQVRGKWSGSQKAVTRWVPTVDKTVGVPTDVGPLPAVQLPPGHVALPGVGPLAQFRLVDHRQSLVGNQLRVDTSVDITDQRDGVAYVWALTVSADGGGMPNGAPTVKMVYDHQVFDVAATGHDSPTFSEAIELPSGRHFVEVGLYSFVKGQDLSFLNDLKAARSQLMVGGSGTVIVP